MSLQCARPHVDGARDLLIMNIDHIYRPAISALAAAPADEVTAFVDTDRTLGDDDMKVERDGGEGPPASPRRWSSGTPGYVGMTKIPAAAEAARYWAEADAALAEEGRAIHVERVLARLADARRAARVPRHQRPRLAGGGPAGRARARRSSAARGRVVGSDVRHRRGARARA